MWGEAPRWTHLRGGSKLTSAATGMPRSLRTRMVSCDTSASLRGIGLIWGGGIKLLVNAGRTERTPSGISRAEGTRGLPEISGSDGAACRSPVRGHGLGSGEGQPIVSW